MEAKISVFLVKGGGRCSWLKEGDKNTKSFHPLAFVRMWTNKISFLMDGESKLDDRESIIRHINDFFVELYSKEDLNCPYLDNLAIADLCDESVVWLERPFEEEVRAAVFVLGSDKASGPDGFPMAFFQRF